MAARFRDLDLAEEAFADACLAAIPAWRRDGQPHDAAAWLYRASHARALDALRRHRVRRDALLEPPPEPPTPEDIMLDADDPIPDERLRLIFICCHPAIAPDSRAALTLRVICGLAIERLARAFLVSEPTLLQRITRAKRKIRDAGVPFETPGREMWAERLTAVLTTLEIAYAQAYEDAAGTGGAADLGPDVIRLTGILAELLPDEPEVLGLAALVRLAEARRPARLTADGVMIPLSEQDVALWDREMIDDGLALLDRAVAMRRSGPYQLMAAIHACHAERLNAGRTEWRNVLLLYDALARLRASPVIAVNRAMALGEIEGPDAALAALDAVSHPRLANWRPYQAVRAVWLAKAGRAGEAASALRAALALAPPDAERRFLERRLEALERQVAG